MWGRYVLTIGALMGGFGVACGAFGAHALRELLTASELLIFETAIRYWFYHVPAILVVGIVLIMQENRYLKSSAISMILGTTIFSLSLIAIVVTGNRFFGAVTPVGGLMLISGWILLAIGVRPLSLRK